MHERIGEQSVLSKHVVERELFQTIAETVGQDRRGLRGSDGRAPLRQSAPTVAPVAAGGGANAAYKAQDYEQSITHYGEALSEAEAEPVTVHAQAIQSFISMRLFAKLQHQSHRLRALAALLGQAN